MSKNEFLEEKIFDNPELDRLTKEIIASGALTERDAEKMCSGGIMRLDELRRMRKAEAKLAH